jgi:ADP-L-glycero-D-manno-heptose 6-epimerase
MTILITGAAGFIGSCLVDTFPADQLLLCDPRDDKMLNPDAAVGAIADGAVTAVYHMGAISSTTVTDLVKVTQENILFSSRLLEACLEKNIPFVYASSASVYGTIVGPHREWQPMKPVNYYAITKTAFDMMVRQKIKDIPTARIVGLRYFNVYGHREDHKGDMASPVHKFIHQAMENKQIQIFEGSDGYHRDFVHIEDVVKMTKAAVDFESDIYNVGTGIPRSFLDVANIIAKKLDAQVVEIPFPEHLKGKYQRNTQSDNEKITHAGYSTIRISLEEGIEKVLAKR